MLSVIIAGSRTVDPPIEDVDAALVKLLKKYYPNAHAVLMASFSDDAAIQSDATLPNWTSVILEVVCGEADGGDNAGARWAACRGIPIHSEPITEQDIITHGKYVGPRMRNRRMAERADCLVAFWDGISGGTSDMSTRMTAREKPQLVIPTKKAQSRPRRRMAKLDRALAPQ